MTRRQFAAMLGAAPTILHSSPATVGFAIGTYGLKSLDTVDALRAIAGIGYDGVSLALMPGWKCDPSVLSGAETKRIASALSDLHLAVAAVNDQLPLIGTPEKRRWNLERIRLAAGFTRTVTRSTSVCLDTMLGLKTSEWDAAKNRMADELHDWARVAESEEFVVGIKPHAGQAMDTPEKALWMLKQLNSSKIRLIYDYSHMRVGGFPLEQSLRELLPHTAFISVKDSVGGPDNFEFLLPGAGDTDYLRYFTLLRDLTYQGFVSVEVSAMVQRKPGYDGVAAARSSYEKLAPYFRKAALPRPAH